MATRALAQTQREEEFIRTANLVNKFAISTVQFLNRFAALCDTKLFETNRSLRRLEHLTVLLETKLRSVDEVDDGTPTVSGLDPIASPPPLASNGTRDVSPLAVLDRQNVPPPMPGLLMPRVGGAQPPPPPQRNGPPLPPGVAMPAAPNAVSGVLLASPLPPSLPGQPPTGYVPPPPPPIPLLGTFSMSTHPRLKGYFQMLALRVPAAAVRAKMQADGHPPEWLDTPDAAAPSTIPAIKNALYDSD